MNNDYNYLEKYHIHGGTYEIPVEMVNDLVGEIKDLKQALNEIRKYVVNLKENSVNSVCYLEEMYEIDVDIKQDILQRLDKYLGDEK